MRVGLDRALGGLGLERRVFACFGHVFEFIFLLRVDVDRELHPAQARAATAASTASRTASTGGLALGRLDQDLAAFAVAQPKAGRRAQERRPGAAGAA